MICCIHWVNTGCGLFPWLGPGWLCRERENPADATSPPFTPSFVKLPPSSESGKLLSPFKDTRRLRSSRRKGTRGGGRERKVSKEEDFWVFWCRGGRKGEIIKLEWKLSLGGWTRFGGEKISLFNINMWKCFNPFWLKLLFYLRNERNREIWDADPEEVIVWWREGRRGTPPRELTSIQTPLFSF